MKEKRAGTKAFEKEAQISHIELEEKRQIEVAKEKLVKKLQQNFKPQKIKIDRVAPVVYATFTKKQIATIAQYSEVGRIFLHQTEGISDLTNSISIAKSDEVQSSGVKGSGIKVAVWEKGPDETDKLVITDFYDPSQTNKEDHARLTHAVIKNKQTGPNGHAPSCDLYSANHNDIDALSWAVQIKECTVVSQSFHRNNEQTSSSLSYDDIYKDWLILHWPYPTIIQAAGNGEADEYVNHKGYNSLCIGNHDDTAGTMAGDSVFRNPSSLHADRELPELCANGIGVTAVGLTMTGT